VSGGGARVHGAGQYALKAQEDKQAGFKEHAIGQVGVGTRTVLAEWAWKAREMGRVRELER